MNILCSAQQLIPCYKRTLELDLVPAENNMDTFLYPVVPKITVLVLLIFAIIASGPSEVQCFRLDIRMDDSMNSSSLEEHTRTVSNSHSGYNKSFPMVTMDLQQSALPGHPNLLPNETGRPNT